MGSALLTLVALVALGGCGSSTHKPVKPPITRVTARGQTASSPVVAAAVLQDQFVTVVKAVSPEVVQIQTDAGLGSGVVFDGHGDIVTNAHVVTGAHNISVTLATGRRYPATLVGIDPDNDIAVVHITGATPHPATFANSSTIQVGDVVLAIGNPLGLRSSVTQGIVSSVGRTVSEGTGVVLPSVIQTSAAINPGNSGGALVDLAGNVVGIPTLAALDPETGGTQAPGIGFAIPSSVAAQFATKLIATGRVVRAGRAYLGVVVSSVIGGGVLIVGVQPRGPAAKAGIKPNEVLVSVAGSQTATTSDVTNVLSTLRPGQVVPVQVVTPSGQQTTVHVKLGAQPGR